MGLLDELKSTVTGGAAPAAAQDSSGFAQAVLSMLVNREGGLPGLVSAFQAKGMGNIVSSWISAGNNLPISAEQVQEVMGPEQVQQLAATTGMSPDITRTRLAEILPRVIDQLTPNGTLPQEGLTTKALDVLKKLL